MAKLTKDELKSKIDEKIEDADLKIELLEDIEDSVEFDDVERVEKSELDDLQAKYDELYDKYKSRFLEVKEAKEVIEEVADDIDSDEVKEEKIIDVQEI